MLLSNELVGYVGAALSAGVGNPSVPPVAAPTTDAPQRRREPRVGVRARATLIPLTDRVGLAPFDVTVRDFSAGGIGFIHRDRLALDGQFVALLPGGPNSLAVLCQVAYYEPLPGHGFAVGAKFVRVLREPGTVEERQRGDVRRVAS